MRQLWLFAFAPIPDCSLARFAGNTYNICMWHFSRHMLQRIEERGYTRGQILQIVDIEVNVLVVQSPRDMEVDPYFGLVDSKWILVVVNRFTKGLITVRPMREKEKKLYEKEFDNA
jgi:hypothetical protein